MTLSRDRMLEYLYDELLGDERAAFEAQLAASEPDRRELDALRATLGETRALLANDPAPPARVRTHVLAAAEAQLRAAAPEREIRPRAQRWLRATWIVPSLAIAAAALLMVSKRDANQLEREVAGKSHTGESVTPSMPEREETAPPPSAAEPTQGGAALGAGEEPGASKGATSRAEPSAREATRAAQKPAAAAQRGRAPEAPASRAAGQAREAPASNGFAVPPPGWNAAAPRAQSDDGRAPAKPQAAAPAERREPSRDKRSAAPARVESLDGLEAESPMEAPPSAASMRSDGTRYDARVDAAPTLSLTALERRASERAASQSYALALADYRELLRRFPQHAHADAWKKQITQLTRAQSDSSAR